MERLRSQNIKLPEMSSTSVFFSNKLTTIQRPEDKSYPQRL